MARCVAVAADTVTACWAMKALAGDAVCSSGEAAALVLVKIFCGCRLIVCESVVVRGRFEEAALA